MNDSSAVRQFVEYVLRERGTQVFTAENGDEALAIYREHAAEIGLVLTDINMPVKDGFQLIGDLRKEPNPPLLAVMSGRLDPLMRAQLNGMGIERMLAKPFALDEMNQVLALVTA